jgi:hypothetical protein
VESGRREAPFSHWGVERKGGRILRVKRDWETLRDNLSKAGLTWGCVSALDREGRTIWIADAHRDNGKRLVVHTDEKLTAFLALESATRVCGDFS